MREAPAISRLDSKDGLALIRACNNKGLGVFGELPAGSSVFLDVALCHGHLYCRRGVIKQHP